MARAEITHKIYLTDSARKSHSDRINELVKIIATTPGIDYTAAREVENYLLTLQREIDRERTDI
jgi:hypothetical protein